MILVIVDIFVDGFKVTIYKELLNKLYITSQLYSRSDRVIINPSDLVIAQKAPSKI
ncbi:hypothetical protein [Pseudanabaena cinerea]|jgi:hypothetical protein|uniref:hypothetical protein n=1 Tax=Pseudanabaena cinerea TaxID=2661616 RepID=UPI00168130A1|nr:hypothetical protein [Pseudanabaena cinerea]